MTNGSCPDSSTQDVTINTPSTDFNYGGVTEFCLGTTNPVATITGAEGGTFSVTGGLTVDANTGEIDLSTATEIIRVSWHASFAIRADRQISVGEVGDNSGFSLSLSSDGNVVVIDPSF